MFRFGKSKIDYKKICSDTKAVHRLLYEDRTKTAKIMDDQNFINAWFDSENYQQISQMIRKEALSGDVPSLKQMVWLLRRIQEKISAANIDEKERNSSLVDVLKERISHCNKLISEGVLSSHYDAMVSAHHLYRILQKLDEPSIVNTRDALNEMADHAQAVIKLGKNHPAFDGDAGFVSDADTVLREAADLRELLNAMGDTVSRFDDRR